MSRSIKEIDADIYHLMEEREKLYLGHPIQPDKRNALHVRVLRTHAFQGEIHLNGNPLLHIWNPASGWFVVEMSPVAATNVLQFLDGWTRQGPSRPTIQ